MNRLRPTPDRAIRAVDACGADGATSGALGALALPFFGGAPAVATAQLLDERAGLR